MGKCDGMNSVIHCLSFCTPFRSKLIQQAKEDENPKFLPLNPAERKQYYISIELARFLWLLFNSKHTRSVRPTMLRAAMEANTDRFPLGQPQDAFEIGKYFLDTLHAEMCMTLEAVDTVRLPSDNPDVIFSRYVKGNK